MTEPISFTSASPRFSLPLLFAGQAQKEFYVNEAHALTDALLHCAVEGEATDPPAAPAPGDCWIVAATASGAWVGQENSIACFQAGNWLFVAPRNGLRAYNQVSGQEWLYANGWQIPQPIAVPTGGATVDAEARAAISAILAALQQNGVLPNA